MKKGDKHKQSQHCQKEMVLVLRPSTDWHLDAADTMPETLEVPKLWTSTQSGSKKDLHFGHLFVDDEGVEFCVVSNEQPLKSLPVGTLQISIHHCGISTWQ